MPSVATIMSDALRLSSPQQEEFFSQLGEVITLNTHGSLLHEEGREKRYSDGVVCLHCGSVHVIKHGMKNDVQRFMCKDCGKTFNDLSFSPMSRSNIKTSKWLNYAKCMILGYSIRKSARIIEVSVKTSFYMRHRILDAVRNNLGIGNISGIIEMDETYLPESFKGNHQKSGFTMPRPPRKRGKEVKTRGISKEQVCIATAIDRTGNIILEMVTKGRISTRDLKRLYEKRIAHDSSICTDSHKSYISFAATHVAHHYRIPRGKHKTGVYHINHVNSLHSKFKSWIRPFNGVSTKYLSNYLYWFKWLQSFNDEKDLIKAKHLIVDNLTKKTDIRIGEYKTRLPIYV
jgi:transposase-like protein